MKPNFKWFFGAGLIASILFGLYDSSAGNLSAAKFDGFIAMGYGAALLWLNIKNSKSSP